MAGETKVDPSVITSATPSTNLNADQWPDNWPQPLCDDSHGGMGMAGMGGMGNTAHPAVAPTYNTHQDPSALLSPDRSTPPWRSSYAELGTPTALPQDDDVPQPDWAYGYDEEAASVSAPDGQPGPYPAASFDDWPEHTTSWKRQPPLDGDDDARYDDTRYDDRLYHDTPNWADSHAEATYGFEAAPFLDNHRDYHDYLGGEAAYVWPHNPHDEARAYGETSAYDEIRAYDTARAFDAAGCYGQDSGFDSRYQAYPDSDSSAVPLEQAWPGDAWAYQEPQAWPQQDWPQQDRQSNDDREATAWVDGPKQAQHWSEQLLVPPSASHRSPQSSPQHIEFGAMPPPPEAQAPQSPARRVALMGLSGLGFLGLGGAATFGFMSAFKGPALALGQRDALTTAATANSNPWLKPISTYALEQAEALEYLDRESERPSFAGEARPARLQLASLSPEMQANVPAALPLPSAKTTPISPLPRSKPQSVERSALAWAKNQPGTEAEADLDAMIARLSQELPDPAKIAAPPAKAATQTAKRSPQSADGDSSAVSRPALNARGERVRLRNVHNGEEILLAHRGRSGALDPIAVAELEHFMRDWRNDETRRMDLALYDLLARLAPGQDLQVISAYRSPQTNAMLRARSGGVAKNSYHLRGQAIDISPSKQGLEDFYHNALRLNAGGVGYYPGSDFIHVDTGPVREWPSRYKAGAQKYRRGLA